ncbi:MAG: M60 family metallopeptidase [Muribaculaceae bacterium]|nr:M60 family metallopeptidase [Muribaculaceae bacterium]
MKQRISTLILSLLTWWCAISAASIADKGVFRIINVQYGHAMTSAGAGNITCVAVDPDDDAQLWIAEAGPDGGFYMRNYRTGYYMTTPRARSQAWTTQFVISPDDEKTLMKFTENGENYVINTVGSIGQTTDAATHGYAHENSGGTVVCWNTTPDASSWKMESISASASDINAHKEEWNTCVSEIIPGKAYRIRNYNYNDNLAEGTGGSLSALTPDKSSESQIWLVEKYSDGEGYVIRNYKSGRMLKSPNTQSGLWNLVNEYVPDPDKGVLGFTKKDTGFGICTVSMLNSISEGENYTFAHEVPEKLIKSWTIAANASQWHFTEATEITDADIEAMRPTWESFKQYTIDTAFSSIFEDAACTILTPAYASKTPEQLASDPNVLAIPEVLRPMVYKALSGDWTETDAVTGLSWDSRHAKQLRVMMAEPFSESSGAAALVGTQAHGDVNNPTGIITEKGEKLYIFLDEEPAPGTEFRIASRVGEGVPLISLCNTSDGMGLHKGMNVLNCPEEMGNVIIYYTVRTNNRQRAVTDYKPVKVHIEGGSLNGYFNYEGDELYTPDTNEDWLYYRERARYPMFWLVSRYNSLFIHFFDIDNTKCMKSLCSPEEYAAGKFDLRATMKAWDELYLAEAMIMGWLPDEVIEAEKSAGRDYYDSLEGDRMARPDYYKYLNNRHLGLSMRDCGFMNATWWRTAYNPSTISSIIREFPTGDLWGPAHEMGHLNQGPICIAGTSEESNNIFSNVALFYRGQHSSRADFPSVQRDRFNRGENFLQHGVWGTTRMYFQLWLYYHATGRDKKFYPRLFEYLRQNPLRRTSIAGKEGDVNPISAKNDLLHFAKMACMTAQEDLTDFFDAWGFLEVQDAFFIDDYTQYTQYLTAEDIAEWRSEIKRLAAENGWKKNHAIMFIDDRIGSDKQSYEFDKTKCGAMGGLKDYLENTPVTGEYMFVLTGNTVKVSGATGGVGFIIHDDEGNLIGFANDPEFNVNDEAAAKIRDGKYSFNVVTPDNRLIPVVDAVHNGSIEQRLEAMDVLIGKAEALLAKTDPTDRKVGLISGAYVKPLQDTFNLVKGLRETNGITLDNSIELYDALMETYNEAAGITATAENTVKVIPGGVYVFTDNIRLRGYGISANTQGTQLAQVKPENVNMDDPAQQWMFIATDQENYYYIRNIATGKYINKAARDQAIVTLESEPMPQLVLFRELGGTTVTPEGSDHDSLHADDHNRLTRWDSSAAASRWGLTLIENWEYEGAISDLEEITGKSEEIITEAGNVVEDENGEITVEINPDYNFVTEDMLLNLFNLLQRAKELGILTSTPLPLQAKAPAETPTTEEIQDLVRQIEEAYEILNEAMTRNRTRLEDIIEKTAALLEELGEVSDITTPVGLTAESLSSNAYHTQAGSDLFTTWDVVLDGNHDTYFHSSYARTDTPDGLDHWIRIELPQTATDSEDYILSYVTRKGTDALWMPVEATLAASSDGESWQTIAELSDELPRLADYTFESLPIHVPAGSRYMRFMVHKTHRSPQREDCEMPGGHAYFVVSELGLAYYQTSAIADTEDYPQSNTEILMAAQKAVFAGRQVLGRPYSRNPRFDAAYEDLYPIYENLLDIYNNPKIPSGVETVDADKAMDNDVIYDINGVRVKSITDPGFFIVNGRKVIVK